MGCRALYQCARAECPAPRSTWACEPKRPRVRHPLARDTGHDRKRQKAGPGGRPTREPCRACAQPTSSPGGAGLRLSCPTAPIGARSRAYRRVSRACRPRRAPRSHRALCWCSSGAGKAGRPEPHTGHGGAAGARAPMLPRNLRERDPHPCAPCRRLRAGPAGHRRGLRGECRRLCLRAGQAPRSLTLALPPTPTLILTLTLSRSSTARARRSR